MLLFASQLKWSSFYVLLLGSLVPQLGFPPSVDVVAVFDASRSSPLSVFLGGVAPAAYSNLSRLGLILEDAEALLSWQQAAIGLSYYGLVVLKQWSLTNHPKYIYIFIFIKQEKAEGLWWRSMFKTWHSPLLQLAFWRHPILFDIFRVLQVYFFLLFPLLSWTLCSVACILSRFCIWMYPLFTRYKTHLHFPCSLLHMEPFKETISI